MKCHVGRAGMLSWRFSGTLSRTKPIALVSYARSRVAFEFQGGLGYRANARVLVPLRARRIINWIIIKRIFSGRSRVWLISHCATNEALSRQSLR
jgi:hypothetical protein